MRTISASVITIGDELLIGQRIDTNSQWISYELNKIGATVKMHLSIGDEKQDIITALNFAIAHSDIVLITGGLGPTKDDVTKKTLAEYFGSGYSTNQQVLQDVKSYFERRGRAMEKVHYFQAEVPDNCQVIRNTVGTAPGMWFEKENRIIISMPGVPQEMKKMMELDILKRIQSTFGLHKITHMSLSTAGIGESTIAEILKAEEENLPVHIKLAYLPSAGVVKLRLSSISASKDEIQGHYNLIAAKLEKYIYAFEDVTLQQVLASELTKRNQTISIAESCTGGYLAHLFTQMSGSSLYFTGSVTAYSNKIKKEVLQVSDDILKSKGAVSQETVKAMAENIREKFKTTYGISTSGIAGPNGGTREKPVGTVWIACSSPEATCSKLLHLTNDRILNIELSANAALNLLRQSLVK